MELFVSLSERIPERITFNVNLEPLKERAKKAWYWLELYAQYVTRRKKKPEKRKDFSISIKKAVLARQLNRCGSCMSHYPRLQFHHKDRNHSNNSISNCQALCPNCHDMKSWKTKL